MAFTIQQLIDEQNADIRDQTTPNSITKENVTDDLNHITTELERRGIFRVDTTSDLASLAGDDFNQGIVNDYGIFEFLSSGTPNGVTIFAAAGSGVWSLMFYPGTATPVAPIGEKLYNYFTLF